MAIAERLTLEEFLALPEKKPALEYEDGKVTRKAPPMGQHSVLEFAIAERFNSFARPRRLALAIPELRTTYSGYSRVPDVAVDRWERIPVLESGKIANDFREAPDIAVEIVSPGQSVNYLVRRCLWYVEHGVQAALLADPSDESVLIFRPDHTMVALHGSDQVDLQDILPGFHLSCRSRSTPSSSTRRTPEPTRRRACNPTAGYPAARPWQSVWFPNL